MLMICSTHTPLFSVINHLHKYNTTQGDYTKGVKRSTHKFLQTKRTYLKKGK